MEQIFYEPVHPYTKKLSDMARKLYQVPEKKRTGEVILRTQGLGRSFVKIPCLENPDLWKRWNRCLLRFIRVRPLDW